MPVIYISSLHHSQQLMCLKLFLCALKHCHLKSCETLNHCLHCLLPSHRKRWTPLLSGLSSLGWTPVANSEAANPQENCWQNACCSCDPEHQPPLSLNQQGFRKGFPQEWSSACWCCLYLRHVSEGCFSQKRFSLLLECLWHWHLSWPGPGSRCCRGLSGVRLPARSPVDGSPNPAEGWTSGLWCTPGCRETNQTRVMNTHHTHQIHVMNTHTHTHTLPPPPPQRYAHSTYTNIHTYIHTYTLPHVYIYVHSTYTNTNIHHIGMHIPHKRKAYTTCTISYTPNPANTPAIYAHSTQQGWM